MTVIEIAKKLIFKTIFEGFDGGSIELAFDRALELEKEVSVKLKDWDKDTIMSGGVARDRKHKIFFSMPLWSGGYISVDLKKSSYEIHN